MPNKITSTAPTRIDFAGGTLDIYPLFLFVGNSRTINAAIDLNAQVVITRRDDKKITIKSIDTGAYLEADDINSLPSTGPLSLITRVLQYYLPVEGMDIETNLAPPHGSGLGASSALYVALTHAISAWMDKPRDPEKLIRTSNHLEAQLMGMPAGTQDYYPPTYGGIKAIHYELEDIWCEHLEISGDFISMLQDHLIVSYTNITHHSGTTNWTYMRNFFDKKPATVKAMHKIKEIADETYEAFKAHDMNAIAKALDDEWSFRKTLSDEVTNDEIEKMMSEAIKAGALANKLCGAGGGGCMITLAPPDKKEAVIKALEANGATWMHTNLVRDGVKVVIE